jgi:hypothetical protein
VINAAVEKRGKNSKEGGSVTGRTRRRRYKRRAEGRSVKS